MESKIHLGQSTRLGWKAQPQMNVLIIDDYESHGESLVELVQMLGHDAQYAPSFAEAEWLLDLLPFQVALLDFDMPAMTGPTIAANLVKRFPQIRPVIMSARPPDAERRAAIRDWTFVQKPLSREVLQDLFNDISDIFVDAAHQ